MSMPPIAALPASRRAFDLRSRLGAARGGLLPSLLDQGLTSVQSLLISVVLIKLTGPEVFGQFIYVFTLVMIMASLQNGLVGIPALVHVAACSGETRRAALWTLVAVDRRYRLAAAFVTALATLAVTRDPVVLGAAALFCYAHLSRETARNLLFATGAGRKAPLLGIVVFAIFLPAFAGLVWAGWPLAAPFLASAVGIGAALSQIAVTDMRAGERSVSFQALARDYRAAFPGLAWRLAQCCSNELQTRSHVFAVTFLRGVGQAGQLEAGRILWAPLVVLYQTWQKVAQPNLARRITAGETRAALRLAAFSIAALASVAGVYAAILLMLWEPLTRALFASFADVRPIAFGWLVYTVLLLANWMLIAFLNAQLRFRTIAVAGMISAAATLTLLLALVLPIPLVSAIVIMVAVQGTLLVALSVIALRPQVAGGTP